MAKKSKLTNEQRIMAVEEYMKGEGSCLSISKKYGIHRETLLSYVKRAQAEGIDVLRISSQNKKYSKATKLAAVNEYLT